LNNDPVHEVAGKQPVIQASVAAVPATSADQVNSAPIKLPGVPDNQGPVEASVVLTPRKPNKESGILTDPLLALNGIKRGQLDLVIDEIFARDPDCFTHLMVAGSLSDVGTLADILDKCGKQPATEPIDRAVFPCLCAVTAGERRV